MQEYGWHGAIEDMMWATDTLRDGLTELDWDKLKPELSLARSNWTRDVIAHAQQGGASFGSPGEQDG